MQGNGAKDFKSVDRVSKGMLALISIYIASNTLKDQRPGEEAGLGTGGIEVTEGELVNGEYCTHQANLSTEYC